MALNRTGKRLTKRQIATLVNKALKDKPKTFPVEGYKYLKDLEVGSLFETSSGTRGVLIDAEINASVLITDVPNISKEDKNYYLGKQIISLYTEVKEVVN